MKRIFILSAIFVLGFPARSARADALFDRYFTGTTMRVDVYHVGTKSDEKLVVNRLAEEGEWPGSETALVDTMNLGEYLFTVVDLATSRTIYSRGYSAMFNEWQTTDEAASGATKVLEESFRFPMPRAAVQLTVSRRNRENAFIQFFSTIIDPATADIHRERSSVNAPVIDIMVNGDAHEKVDLVLLGDGYTKAEMTKFRTDVRHFTDVLFSTPPFKDRKKDFNVRAVEVASEESGIDQPDEHRWVRNALGTSYNTFGSARYVLTEDNRDVRDYAALAPYDFILILVNQARYGGGGIFQLYTTCYATGETPATAWQADYVFVHEFGHAFAGLGDEYYSSSVAYNDFYPKGVEPWEPNIARSVSRASLKWSDLVLPTTPLPTPWGKEEYDSIEVARTKLQRNEPGYAEKRQQLLEAEANILKDQRYKGVVGAFEGAGYSSRGLYRPSVDCRMFSLSLVPFDPVCSRAINRMIDFYTH